MQWPSWPQLSLIPPTIEDETLEDSQIVHQSNLCGVADQWMLKLYALDNTTNSFATMLSLEENREVAVGRAPSKDLQNAAAALLKLS